MSVDLSSSFDRLSHHSSRLHSHRSSSRHPYQSSRPVPSSSASSSSPSPSSGLPQLPAAPSTNSLLNSLSPFSTSCLAALRSAGLGGASPGCNSAVQSAGNDHNNHYHLHLHNYMSSNAAASVAMNSRMVACDRAIESMRPEQDRLFCDPLAATLAGAEMVERALSRQREAQQRLTEAKRMEAQERLKAEREAMALRAANLNINNTTTSASASSAPPAPSSSTPSTTASSTPSSSSLSSPPTVPLRLLPTPLSSPSPSTPFPNRGRMGAEQDPSKTPRVAVRTRYFDDFLTATIEAATGKERIGQVVLVAAGMDARAYRLDCLRKKKKTQHDVKLHVIGQDEHQGEMEQPEQEEPIKLFELDQQAILTYKNNTLQAMSNPPIPICTRIPVPVDMTSQVAQPVATELLFSATHSSFERPHYPLPSNTDSAPASPNQDYSVQPQDNSFPSYIPPPSPTSPHRLPFDLPPTVSLSAWAYTLLTQYNFNPHEATIWLLEGNLMYMTDEQQCNILRDISILSCEGSWLGFSHINAKALTNVQRSGMAWGVMGNNTWNSCLTDQFLQLMRQYGWEIEKFTQLGAPDANYGRWLAPVWPIDDPERGTTLYVTAKKVDKTAFPEEERRRHEEFMQQQQQQLQQQQQRQQELVSEQPRMDYDDGKSPEHPSSSSDVPTSSASSTIELESDDESATASMGSASPPLPAAGEARAEAEAGPSPSPLEMEKEERDQVVESWNLRAAAYVQMTKSYPIFANMAKRLIQSIPINQSSPSAALAPIRIVDLGCGGGLVSQLMLSRFPLSRVHMVDPSLSMINIARRTMQEKHGNGSLLSCDMLRGEQVGVIATEYTYVPVTAVISSAAMHLMKERDIFPQVANLIKPGGAFIYNLWAHSFDETLEQEERNQQVWKICVNQALKEEGEQVEYPEVEEAREVEERIKRAKEAAAAAAAAAEASAASFSPSVPSTSLFSSTSSVGVSSPRPPLQSVRSRSSLSALGVQHGLVLDQLVIDTDAVRADFYVNFHAMRDEWLSRVVPREKKNKTIDRARELGREKMLQVQTVRIRMIKPATPA